MAKTPTVDDLQHLDAENDRLAAAFARVTLERDDLEKATAGRDERIADLEQALGTLIKWWKIDARGRAADAKDAAYRAACETLNGSPEGQRLLRMFSEQVQGVVDEHVVAGRGHIEGNRLVPNEDES